MMARSPTTTTTTTTRHANIATTIANRATTPFQKEPSPVCRGFIDIDGIWNNGFLCPIEGSIQYFCCGTDTHRYCCPPDRYSFKTEHYADLNSIINNHHTYNDILTDEVSASLISNQRMINKQFQQFQKYFLPTFLLTTTVLFLVGIALWFWLYKHKTYYALTQDDEMTTGTISQQTHRIDSTVLLDKNENIDGQQQSEALVLSSTTV